MWLWLLLFLCNAVLCTPVSLEEGEEGGVDPVNIAIAIMLFGSITFQMSLFYLVNHPDNDMKRYSWETVSSTISIFCAVLIFEGCDGIVDYYLEDVSNTQKVLGAFAHFFVWVLALQMTLFYHSGAHEGAISLGSSEIKLFKHSAKASSVLLSHTTGFASINAWGSIQQLPFFSASPLRCFFVVFLALICMLAFYKATDTWRERKALQNDGVIDANEELWDDEVREAENDAVGLTVSFLCIQATRYATCSVLPDQTGVLHVVLNHSQIGALLATSLLFLVGVVFFGHYHRIASEEFKNTIQGRLLCCMLIVSSMCFAWCVLYAIVGEVVHAQWFAKAEGVMVRVLIALLVSAASFTLIYSLDKVIDLKFFNDDVTNALIMIIMSFGIMVGFSWEHCFDAGIKTISYAALPPGPERPWGQLGMSLVLATIVLPAWKAYILPFVLSPYVCSAEIEASYVAMIHRYGTDSNEEVPIRSASTHRFVNNVKPGLFLSSFRYGPNPDATRRRTSASSFTRPVTEVTGLLSLNH